MAKRKLTREEALTFENLSSLTSPKSTTQQHEIKVEFKTAQSNFFMSVDSLVSVSVNGRPVAQIASLKDKPPLTAALDHERLQKYFEDHLEEELERSTLSLFLEARDFSVALGRSSFVPFSPQRSKIPGAAREKIIARRVKAYEKALRKRIPLGARPMSKNEDLEFLKKAITAARELAKEDGHLTRTKLAEHLYPNSDNKLQSLRRRLKLMLHPMDFDDILLMAGLHPDQLASAGHPKRHLKRRRNGHG